MDKSETNFRLMLISQRETNAKLNEVSVGLTETGDAIRTMAAQMAAQMAALATKVDTLGATLKVAAHKGEETADRLEDTIQIMKSFADGQAEMRVTLAECVRRLDALEGQQAS